MDADLDTIVTALYVKIDDSLVKDRRPGHPARLSQAEPLRAALPLVKQVIRDLAADSDFWFDNVWIADSTPVECGRSVPTVRRSQMAGWAGYGYCASHSRRCGQPMAAG